MINGKQRTLQGGVYWSQKEEQRLRELMRWYEEKEVWLSNLAPQQRGGKARTGLVGPCCLG